MDFGCVLLPVNFKEKRIIKKEYCARMAPRDFFLSNELSIYTLLQDIKNFYIFETAEKITYNELDENSPSELSIEIDESNYYLLRYPIRNFNSLFVILKTLEKAPLIQFVMNSYEKLLYSINILIDKNIIHNNISYETICVDEDMETFLINFGLSINLNIYTIDYIKQFLLVYNPNYSYWSMEFHILSYMLTNKIECISKIKLDIIIEDVISYMSLDLSNKKKYISESIHFYSKYVNKPISYIVQDILIYKNTWDNFTLSILFLDILSEFDTANTFIVNFKQILKLNTHPIPKIRLTIQNTIESFTKLCYETNIQVFKELF